MSVDYSTEIPADEVLTAVKRFHSEGMELDSVSRNVPKRDWYNSVLDYLREYFTDDAVAVSFSTAAKYRGLGVFFGGVSDEDACGTFNLPAARKCLMKISRGLLSNEGRTKTPASMKSKNVSNTRVFIVHGHDGELKQSVARTIEKLGLDPVILSEQPNHGRTIIEKFIVNSEVGFAVILMTADDVGAKKESRDDELHFRARQNVILELGYFIGAIDRSNIFVLKEDNVEAPSDIFGLVYEAVDSAGHWKYSLAKNLKSTGFDVDLNNI